MTAPYTPQWLTPSNPGQLSNRYGGTSQPYSPPAPSLSTFAGSTNLPAGTYSIAVTFSNRKGESLPGPAATITGVAAGRAVAAFVDSAIRDAESVNFYLVAAPPGVEQGFIGQVDADFGVQLNLTTATQGNPSQVPPTTDTTYDGITLKARYANPSAADAPGSIRVTATKTILQGSPTTSHVIWDTDWLGSPATSPFPDTSSGTINPNCVTVHQGVSRVYVLVPLYDSFPGYAGAVVSAPVAGGSVGSWRYELPVTVTGTTGTQDEPIGLVAIGNWLYAGTQGGIWQADINPFDGTLGAWTLLYTFPGTGGFGLQSGASMNGFDQASFGRIPDQINFFPGSSGGCLVVLDPQTSSADTKVYGWAVSGTDGSITGPNAFPDMAISRAYCALWVNSTDAIYVIGGYDQTGAVQTTVQYLGINLVGGNQNGVAPTAWTAGANLPVPRARFAFLSDDWYMGVYGEYGTAFVIGGVDGGTHNESNPASTVYYLDGYNMKTSGYAWHLSAHTLPTPVYGAGGVILGVQQFADNFPNGGPVSGYIGVISGQNLGTSDLTTKTPIQVAVRPDVNDSPWVNGPGAPLTAGPLGFNGQVTANPDGSVDVTFLYNLGAGVISPVEGTGFQLLYDGDQVQFTVQFTDSQGGDVSPVATTLLSIGQPPTLTSPNPSGPIASALPTASFLYAAGKGGGPEATWRIQVYDNTGTLVFDTGIRLDQANSAVIAAAPMLAPVPHSIVFTATSSDTPVDSGSSNTATVTTTIQPEYAAPPAPSSFSVTPDTVRGGASLAVVNQAAPGAAPAIADAGPGGVDPLVISGRRPWPAVTGVQPSIITPPATPPPIVTGSRGHRRLILLPGRSVIVGGTAALIKQGRRQSLWAWQRPTIIRPPAPPSPIVVGNPPSPRRPATGAAAVKIGQPAPLHSQVLQAELATLANGAVVANNHAGYTGTGFVPMAGVTNSITFAVSVPSAGNYGVDIRYANAQSGPRTLSLYVNGTKFGQLTYPVTGPTWDSWGDGLATIPLLAGSNTVALVYDPSDTGNFNIDYLLVESGFELVYTYVSAAGESPPSPASAPLVLTSTGDMVSVAAITGVPAGVTALNFYWVTVSTAGDTTGFVTSQPVVGGTVAAFIITAQGNGTGPPPPAVANRIYYRRTGTSTWYLLVDGQNPAETAVLLDQLAIGGAYDFAVSALDATGTMESALAAAQTGMVIPAPSGGATAVLHVQGQGQALFVPLYLTGSPTVNEYVDHTATVMFGQTAPAVRYGIADYRDVTVKARLIDMSGDPQAAGAYAALQAVTKAIKRGAVGVFRSAAGTLLTVAQAQVGGTVSTPLASMTFLPQGYLSMREWNLMLLETPNQYQPSTANGYARGYLNQVDGEVQPLSDLEKAL